MKLRRAILGVMVLGGILLLILGVLGVFSRNPKPAPPPSDETAPAVPETRMEAIIREFRVEEKDWSLYAAEARTGGGEDIELTKPALQFNREGKDGVEHLEITADEGAYVKAPVERISMSGNVRLTWMGPEEAILTAESLDVEPDTGVGRADGPVTLSATTKEGPQKAWGEGVEFKFKDRLITIAKNVRLELTGRSLFATGTEEAAPPILLTCDGPVRVDGYRRSVEFRNNVKLQQGESILRADTLKADFASDAPELERLAAEGQVHIEAQGGVGEADRLLRTALGDQIILEGRPAVMRQGGSEIRGDRIEMDPAGGGILVPSEGTLRFEPPKDAEGAPIDVSWSKMLRFNSTEHRALLDGDVVFASGDRKFTCRRLLVRLDAENRRMLECRGEEEVHLAGRFGEEAEGSGGQVDATADSLLYDPENSGIALIGNAVVRREEGTVSGERIEFDQTSAAMRVRGPGSLEGAASPEEGGEPFKIAWTGGMSFDNNSREALFEREVSLEHGDRTLTADRMIGRVDEKGALRGFEATGNAQVLEALSDGASRALKADRIQAETGAGNRIESFKAEGHARVDERHPGNPPRTVDAEVIDARMGEGNALEGLEATGNVVIKDAFEGHEYVIRAGNVKGRLGPDGGIAGLEATGGRVTVEETGRIAEGTRLLWDMETNKGTLSGRPVVFRDGANRVVGDRIEFSRAEGTIRVTSDTGRVEASLQRGGSGGVKLPF
jgi:lipopolysaccharide transport protein LptA